MPFNSNEITTLGYASINAYMRNHPIDQVGYQHPFLSKLVAAKKPFKGALQYCVENIRKSYDSNFQHYHGADAITFKKKDTLEHANYTWGSGFDGFQLSEDDLITNGVAFNDETRNNYSKDDKVALVDLLKENLETLRLGFEEKLDLSVHQDGSQDVDAVAGLDHLVSLAPNTGTIGGLDAATYPFWRNSAATGIAEADLINTLETHWRKCIRNGGRPDCIMMGSTALDTYRAATKTEIGRYTVLNTSGETPAMDPSVTNLHFKNVPVVWNPTFEELDNLLSPAQAWEKRIYMLNTKHIKYRPIKGHDMTPRKPQREHDRFVWYWGMTTKYAISMNRRNAHSAISVA